MHDALPCPGHCHVLRVYLDPEIDSFCCRTIAELWECSFVKKKKDASPCPGHCLVETLAGGEGGGRDFRYTTLCTENRLPISGPFNEFHFFVGGKWEETFSCGSVGGSARLWQDPKCTPSPRPPLGSSSNDLGWGSLGPNATEARRLCHACC